MLAPHYTSGDMQRLGITSEAASERSCPLRTKLRPALVVSDCSGRHVRPAEACREQGVTSERTSERSCPPRTKLRPPLVVFPLSRYLSESDRVLVGIRWFGCHHCYCTPCHPSGAMPCAAGSSRKSNQSDLTSPISEIKYKIPDLRSFRFSIFEIFDF